MLGPRNTQNLSICSKAIRQSISKTNLNLNASFIKQSLEDKSFLHLVKEIRESNRKYYLNKLLSFSVYSIWHFLGEPTSKGVFFSKEFEDNNTAPIKELFFKKEIGSQTLISILEKTDSLKTIHISDEKEKVPRPKTESDLKALHDPMNVTERVPIQLEEKEALSPKKVITDWLEQTPDYLNFFPVNTKNVLMKKKHLIPDDILLELLDPSSMIDIDQLLVERSSMGSSTFFNTVVSQHVSVITLKMHLLSILLSKKNRTAFGLSHLDIDPMVNTRLHTF